MSTIEAQIELEKSMASRGAAAYIQRNERQAENGRGSETGYARRLMQELIDPISEAVQEFICRKGPGQRGKVRPLLRQCPPETAVLLALKAVFNSFVTPSVLSALAVRIGGMIEDEVRVTKFSEKYKEHYKLVIGDWKAKKVASYQHKKNSMIHKANKMEDGWQSWTVAERADIGMTMLDLILRHSDLIEKVKYFKNKKSVVEIVPTAATKEWIKNHNDFAEFLCPEKLPCIVEPDKWTALNSGGYYTPKLRRNVPMIRTPFGMRKDKFKEFLETTDLSKPAEALNVLQSQAWKINNRILPLIKEAWNNNMPIGMPTKEPLEIPPCPIEIEDKDNMTDEEAHVFSNWKAEASQAYTDEKEREAKAHQAVRIVRVATEFAEHERFYFVWSYDSRGRAYPATDSFSPQGPDIAKGLLEFHNGEFMTYEGLDQLMISMANRFGYDKVSYDDRIQWVEDNHESIVHAVADPINNRDWWTDADKPWQFLAACMEYVDICKHLAEDRPIEEFITYLSIGVDGTCNGLQNFSAMLRDDVGGKATNLTRGDKPADIYTEVAQVCTQKLRDAPDCQEKVIILEYLDTHCKGAVPRKQAKRPVMTQPYGSTRNSCTQYIAKYWYEQKHGDFFTDRGVKVFDMAAYMTKFMWAAISEVVIAARAAMDWLQECSSVFSKNDMPITWRLPDGFAVIQKTCKVKSRQIDTRLAGRFQLKIGEATDDIDSRKQRSGVAPNFVHSCDAYHMRSTVLHMHEAGLQGFHMVHDDFGTHAPNVGKLQSLLREAFVSFYAHSDPLAEFAAASGLDLPAIPPRGLLDIQDVNDSPYFFG